MPNDDLILRSDAVSAFCGNCEGTEVCGQLGEPCEEVKRIKAIPAADVEPKRRWIPVTERLPREGENVLVYDGSFRVGKIEKGISIGERDRMKRGELPDPEEWGWNLARGYFNVRRSESYKGCDEQGNNERPYCWRVDNGHGTLFGQDVKYWTPLPEPPKEEKDNENRT